MERKEEPSYFHHLDDVNMSYFEHFLFSCKFSLYMFFGSIAALIHAIYPDIFITSTTNIVNYMNIELYKQKNENENK